MNGSHSAIAQSSQRHVRRATGRPEARPGGAGGGGDRGRRDRHDPLEEAVRSRPSCGAARAGPPRRRLSAEHAGNTYLIMSGMPRPPAAP